MTLSHITTREQLEQYLYAALQLEHATIPPYLTALYSIQPGTNSDAYHLLRVVAVEEMLHLTLAANIMNAVGGAPDLTGPDFVPVYPVFLPDGEQDFQVGLQRFSKEALDTFLQIERPAAAPSTERRTVRRSRPKRALPVVNPAGDDELHFYSIGEFYHEIELGLEQLGEDVFAGDPARQITPEYYYSGGGEVIPVTDLASAKAAIRLISEQGEGFEGGIYDEEGELAHYYRFLQLKEGRYYRAGDTVSAPSGPRLDIDWDAVYPAATNARVEMYPAGSELRTAAECFNADYAEFLALVTRAFTGRPELLTPAVGDMMTLKGKAMSLMRNPIPGQAGVNAAPTFEIAGRS